ncbi:hypothetical protein SPRG_10072 [Saprolegnia parasitica CBS 223.65]|uniref:Uncharacterized protein n=1 Tax=Saprolegnia parasitica (strain CBS 223.65) TaxID=695850 RepID=A0A067CBK5_SAPPC|nr:hypothetical protein SPRG_10072 [Saprolegnia parasitica CBS 223.65]KDO23926.1 hypothetical protein SPRG_10072 [Saprolegnia parasitica CBS 223.65]|eukprot:XP_012205392.1 hypothetical protein SPRG_10072 [Saprolegnia parasitica CBS 223.65]
MGASVDGDGVAACSAKASFLGVGNAECISMHLAYASFLVAVIVAISVVLDAILAYSRRAIQCPQMKRIVNRFFEELMIMGFISMCIFAIDTSGLVEEVSFGVDNLTRLQLLHFQEFFHYVVFMTTVYYVAIMLLLLVIATVVPRLLYGTPRDEHDEHAAPLLEHGDTVDALLSPLSDVYPRQYDAAKRARDETSGYNFVHASRMYCLLRQRYKREGVFFKFNLLKQFALWKSFELLAYNVCQYRSKYLYKNPSEMQRIFGLSHRSSHHVSFRRFHTLCTRHLLATVAHLHYTTFFVLVVLIFAAGALPTATAYVFLGLATCLAILTFVIMIKTLRILKGIIKDRLLVLTREDIDAMLQRSSCNDPDPLPSPERRRPTLKGVAQMVRATIRLQMSVLCHRQLHYHDARFWFRRPWFLLRLFQLSTTGQAFYLVWLTLVVVKDPLLPSWMLACMVLAPLTSLLILTPLTMPSLVLVMSLAGFFVEQDPHGQNNNGFDELQPQHLTAKDRIRIARKSYLRNTEETSTSVPCNADVCQSFSSKGSVAALPAASPQASDMLLHMYDLPLVSPASSSGRHSKRGTRSIVTTPVEAEYTLQGTPRSFFQETKMFQNYCSSYGGYATPSNTVTTGNNYTYNDGDNDNNTPAVRGDEAA